MSNNRNNFEYLKWKFQVFNRDNYVCQCCGSHDKLEAHHIVNYLSNEDKRTDISNGITLCRECHSAYVFGSFHDIFGTFNNTKEQLDEYIINRKRDTFYYINKKNLDNEWVTKWKNILLNNIEYLDSKEFEFKYPYLYQLIRNRKKHLQKILLHFSELITPNLKYDNKPLFFGSVSTLMDICGINANRSNTVISQSLTLFALLNMIDKVELNNIPSEELNKAKSISAKYGFSKITNFYQFGDYGVLQLENSEETAKTLIDNHITLKGISREYVLRTFGKELSDKVYPQYTYNNKIGTSKKSNDKTKELALKLLDTIDKCGFMLERDIKSNGRNETQWKRSIAEILNSYELKRVRLTKNLKQELGITDMNGYPFIIVKDI
jgi:hypothetical protein